jgi:hypothetical protein
LSEDETQDLSHYECAAVAMNLDGVLPRVTARLAHDRKKNFVKDPIGLWIPDAAVIKTVRFQQAVFTRRADKSSR